jgi:uncharacterized protein (DUF305 family)
MIATSAPANTHVRERAVSVLLTILLVLITLVSVAFAGWTLRDSATPTDDSVEAGFARDMQVHHAQAVEMAFLIRDRTTDPTLRTVALDIISSQQQQMGQMFGWLTLWDLPQSGTSEPMAWMTDTSDEEMSMEDVTQDADPALGMPGMASEADLQQLEDSRGRRAELTFLRLMIAHHRGGVQMAQRALEMSDHPDVRTLAQAIATSQAAEIEQMQKLLQEREAQG